MKKNILQISKYAISLGLLVFLLSKLHIADLIGKLGGANPYYLALALTMGFSYLLSISLRWRLLLVPSGAKASWSEILHFQTVGFFYATCIPGSVAGDVYRGQKSAKIGLSKTAGYSVVLVDRLVGLASSALMVLGALAFGLKILIGTDLLLYLLLFLAGIAAVILCLFGRRFIRLPNWVPERVRKIYGRFDATLRIYAEKGRSAILLSLLAGLLSHLLLVARIYCLTLAFQIDVSLSYLLFCVPLIGALSLVPITVGGVGLREVGYLFFLSKVGVSEEAAILISLLFFTVSLALATTGGIWQVLRLLFSPPLQAPDYRPDPSDTSPIPPPVEYDLSLAGHK